MRKSFKYIIDTKDISPQTLTSIATIYQNILEMLGYDKNPWINYVPIGQIEVWDDMLQYTSYDGHLCVIENDKHPKEYARIHELLSEFCVATISIDHCSYFTKTCFVLKSYIECFNNLISCHAEHDQRRDVIDIIYHVMRLENNGLKLNHAEDILNDPACQTKLREIWWDEDIYDMAKIISRRYRKLENKWQLRKLAVHLADGYTELNCTGRCETCRLIPVTNSDNEKGENNNDTV